MLCLTGRETRVCFSGSNKEGLAQFPQGLQLKKAHQEYTVIKSITCSLHQSDKWQITSRKRQESNGEGKKGSQWLNIAAWTQKVRAFSKWWERWEHSHSESLFSHSFFSKQNLQHPFRQKNRSQTFSSSRKQLLVWFYILIFCTLRCSRRVSTDWAN